MKIIEKNAHYAEVASRTLHNAEILNGDALSSAIMQEADMVDCDTFISVTNDDKTNILAALLAKKHGAQRVISLLNDMQNTSFFLSQGIDSIIDQNAITVATILKIIRQRSVRFVYTLEGIIEIIEAPIDETSHILGLTIEEITLPGQAFVAALKRKDDVYLLPQNFVLSAQDRHSANPHRRRLKFLQGK